VWAGVANLGVVVVSYDAMMSPHPWRQPTSPAYMVLTFWAATVLMMWCAVELVVDGLKRMRAHRSMPPVEVRPVSLGAWILAGLLSLCVGRNAVGWILEPSWRQHSDIFYLLGLTVVQALLVMAFDISLIRRVVKLRRTSRVDSSRNCC
jgi:hypothetical protein